MKPAECRVLLYVYIYTCTCVNILGRLVLLSLTDAAWNQNYPMTRPHSIPQRF